MQNPGKISGPEGKNKADKHFLSKKRSLKNEWTKSCFLQLYD
jgi:hypothetical protein